MTETDGLVLTFGKATWPRDALIRETTALSRTGRGLGQRLAIVKPGIGAFRLNSRGWLHIAPEMIAALKGRADLRLLCADRLEATTPTFSARTRRWNSLYLSKLESTTVCEPDLPMGINLMSDRYFTGLLPIPSPRLTLLSSVLGPSDASHQDEMAQLDFAIWDGSNLTGVLFGSEAASHPGARRAFERLLEKAGSLFSLVRLETEQHAEQFAEDLANRAVETPPPWFGPYRSEALFLPLP